MACAHLSPAPLCPQTLFSLVSLNSGPVIPPGQDQSSLRALGTEMGCDIHVLSLHCKDLVAGDCSGGLCGKRSWTALCPTQPVPASPVSYLPQGKADTISNVGGALETTYLREIKTVTSNVRKGSVRNYPADTRAREEEGGGGAPGATAEIAQQPVEETTVEQVFPCSLCRILHQMPCHGLGTVESPHCNRFILKGCRSWEGTTGELWNCS